MDKAIGGNRPNQTETRRRASFSFASRRSPVRSRYAPSPFCRDVPVRSPALAFHPSASRRLPTGRSRPHAAVVSMVIHSASPSRRSFSLRVVTETEELGRGGRLRGGAADELVAAAYASESAH